MGNKLVSIISPCYNGEKYVCRFIDSVIQQDYRPIELIIINDGSTDKTAELLESMTPICEQNNIRFSYFSQENKGQAAAINVGLREYSGEYLCWVDSDDVLKPQNISAKVDFLEHNSEYGFVITEAEEVIFDGTDTVVKAFRRKRPNGEDTLFEDLIYEKNVIFTPGVYMVRADAIKKAIPFGDIYESRQGQNWQMLLPLAYNYKCGYIEQSLFQYFVHTDSHSRMKRTYEQLRERQTGFEILLIETIKRIQQMPENEKEEWIRKIKIKHSMNIVRLAIKNNDIKTYLEMKKKIETCGGNLKMKESFIYGMSIKAITKMKMLFHLSEK